MMFLNLKVLFAYTTDPCEGQDGGLGVGLREALPMRAFKETLRQKVATNSQKAATINIKGENNCDSNSLY